ncbi:GIY-YIG nuclease family protein [Aeromonas veronii]|uniref:GIY-YIG nuclease family protein n=1 Tax=Aeromonas veronii TaxID=654 RepID=UPI0009B885D4|nr:GIY-YIG nuclease family protein [Aeromonas veronii]
MTGYRQQKPKNSLTKCPDLVDHYNSDDAPALEAALHREFREHRVNAVNLIKEFFQVDLLSIKDAVDTIVDIDADFKMTALAEEYYESLRLQAVEPVLDNKALSPAEVA